METVVRPSTRRLDIMVGDRNLPDEGPSSGRSLATDISQR